MISRRVLFLITLASAALFALWPTHARAAENATLTADMLEYDPVAGEIKAIGGVKITRSDGEVYGDEGRGTADGRVIELIGNVRGSFFDGEEIADVECGRLKISDDVGGRVITAREGVIIIRGEDMLSAEDVSWTQGRDKYSASGRVIAKWGDHTLDADGASRDGDAFDADGVRRYEDVARGLVLSASRVDGRLDAGLLNELVAKGSVMIDAPDDARERIVVHGSTAVWSEARGTIVVSGGAFATRADRTLSAGSIVYHVDTGRVEAVERPSLTIEIND